VTPLGQAVGARTARFQELLMRVCRFRLGLALPAAALLLATATLARGDLIFFADGFTIQGEVKEQRVLVTDSFSKESWVVPRGVYVDDGPRRFFFSYKGLDADKTVKRAEDAIGTGRYPKGVILPENRGIPIMLNVVDEGTFNEKWDRTFVYQTAGRWVKVPEHLLRLTSFYAQVASTKHFLLNSFYLTQELGYDKVRKLLSDNPALKDSEKLAPAAPPPAASACTASSSRLVGMTRRATSWTPFCVICPTRRRRSRRSASG